MEEYSAISNINDKQTFKSNFAEVEKCFRELQSELYMKRNEVSKLKTELEQANQEINKLRASEDKLKKDSEENQITMDLFMKKSEQFEPKYYEKRDALIKLELQYKIATSKIDVLREDLQNITMQKAQLVRKLDVLEEKQGRETLYSNEISQKLIQLKGTVGTVSDDLEKLKKEQNIAVLMSQQADLAQESIRKCEELSQLSQKLKDENAVLEKKSISFKAMYDKLTDFVTKNAITKEPDLQARVLLTQCKKISAHYKQAMTIKNSILTDLNTHLSEEKDTNLKLIQENQNLNDKITYLEILATDLQAKLDVYEPKEIEDPESTELAEVKKELHTVIEINDD